MHRRPPGPRSHLARTLAWLIVLAMAAIARGEYDRVPDLCRAVTSDSSYKVRISAAMVLGRLRDKRAVHALKKALLTDGHYAVRAMAAQSLGQIGDRAAIPALEKATTDPHEFVRTRAQHALTLLKAPGAPVAKPVHAVTRSGKERFYVGVGGMGDRSRRAGPDMVKRMREFVLRELQQTPGVSLQLDPSRKGKKLKAFTLEGAITDLKRATSRDYVEISCEVSYVVGVYPTHSIVMMTSGGATIQTPRGQFRKAHEHRLQVDALENAVRGAHQNFVAFLKKQR